MSADKPSGPTAAGSALVRGTLPPDLNALVASITLTPIPTVITDCREPDDPIIAANSAFTALTGYAPDEVLGRNCRFLAGPATEAEAQQRLREAIAAGASTVVELTNYRKDGSRFRNAVMLAPVRGAGRAPVLFIGSQMDVTAAGTGRDERQARAADRISALTPRQAQVLRLITEGYRNKQIAGRLGIEEKTVKMHRARLIAALGVATTAEAIRIAVEGGQN